LMKRDGRPSSRADSGIGSTGVGKHPSAHGDLLFQEIVQTAEESLVPRRPRGPRQKRSRRSLNVFFEPAARHDQPEQRQSWVTPARCPAMRQSSRCCCLPGCRCRSSYTGYNDSEVPPVAGVPPVRPPVPGAPPLAGNPPVPLFRFRDNPASCRQTASGCDNAPGASQAPVPLPQSAAGRGRSTGSGVPPAAVVPPVPSAPPDSVPAEPVAHQLSRPRLAPAPVAVAPPLAVAPPVPVLPPLPTTPPVPGAPPVPGCPGSGRTARAAPPAPAAPYS